MFGRALRILVLIYMAAWLGVVVPSHQRGVVQLSGSAASSCCKKHDDPCKKPPTDGRDDKPAATCAICHFIATMDVPPPVVIVAAPSGLVVDANPARHVCPSVPSHPSPISSRGPPHRAA